MSDLSSSLTVDIIELQKILIKAIILCLRWPLGLDRILTIIRFFHGLSE